MNNSLLILILIVIFLYLLITMQPYVLCSILSNDNSSQMFILNQNLFHKSKKKRNNH